MAKSVLKQKFHVKGKTIIYYDEDLNYVISGGKDGLVKVWSLSKNEIIISYSLQSGVKYIVAENERIFINVGNCVQIRSIVNEADVFISFTSNVNDMQLNKRKTKLVACSDDCNIKLINLEKNKNDTKHEILFMGHQDPVHSVSINCDDRYLASASCNGFLLIWDILTGKILKSLEIFDADIFNIKKRYKLKWNPKISKILAIAVGKKIKFVECEGFSIKDNLVCNEGELNDFAFNGEGNLMVGGTGNGWIMIWDVGKFDLLMKWHNSRNSEITSVTWAKPLNVIFSDDSGCWEMIEVKLDQSGFQADEQNFDNFPLTMEELNDLFEGGNENDAKVSQNRDMAKSEVMINIDKEKMSVGNANIDVTGENSEIDEDHEISLADLKASYGYPMENANVSQPVAVSTTTIIRQAKRPPYPPVRSTLCPRNGNKQILMWNPIGALKNHFDKESEYNCFLEVDLQDRAVSHNLIYRHNLMRYEMGDVNRSAVMLVSKQSAGLSDDEEENDDHPAVVHVRPLNSSPWHEWNVALPSNREKVIGCCLVGQIYAVVLTDRHLRYFMANAGGLQADVESIHGSPVAIASSSSYVITQAVEGNFIRVVIVIDDGSKLLWRLELFNGKDQPVKWVNQGKMTAIVATSAWHPLPLSRSATLKWIGFSESGALFTVDSKQSVRRLHIEIDWSFKTFSEPRWSPVLNLKSALHRDFRSTDRYFPIGIMDLHDRCCLLAVHCRGSHYPTVTPWQHLSLIDFRLPICRSAGSDLSELENGLLVNQLVADWADSSGVSLLNEKQLLLKLFGNAVMEDNDSRAFSIGKLMPDSQVIQLAIRYAVRNNKKYLAEKMGQLALQKDEEEELLVEDVQESRVDEFMTESEKKENIDPEISKVINEEAMKFVEGILADNITDERPILSKPLKNPFKAKIVPTHVKCRGLQVIDEMVKDIPIKKSPMKDLNPFGKFVPSPCHQKLKIKTKRKSTRAMECPLEKVMKK